MVAEDNPALLGQIGTEMKMNGTLGEHRAIAKIIS